MWAFIFSFWEYKRDLKNKLLFAFLRRSFYLADYLHLKEKRRS